MKRRTGKGNSRTVVAYRTNARTHNRGRKMREGKRRENRDREGEREYRI